MFVEDVCDNLNDIFSVINFLQRFTLEKALIIGLIWGGVSSWTNYESVCIIWVNIMNLEATPGWCCTFHR